MLPPTRVGVLEVDNEGNPRKLQPTEHRQVMEFYQRLLLKGEVSRVVPEVLGGGGEQSSGGEPSAARYMNEIEEAAGARRLEQEALALRSDSIYRHVWQPGDVVVTHNPSVAHRAPTTEERDNTLGLRVLHRCLALA